MDTIWWILGSTSLVSLISLIGVATLSLKKKLLNKILLVLVGFSAGGLMGGAFLHLLPESFDALDATTASLVLLFGFSLFFVLERILRWRHCHEGKCDIHAFTYLNLVGDGIHNFIDGLIIAASYIVAIPLGIATTIAVIFHEIPQEIGDFGVLVYGGFTVRRALCYNFLSAVTAIVGAVVGYALSGYFAGALPLLLPFAAGGFIYIASSDLIPELHKELNIVKAMVSFVFFLIGIGLMWLLLVVG
jgi:zinc and cadmium transporter